MHLFITHMPVFISKHLCAVVTALWWRCRSISSYKGSLGSVTTKWTCGGMQGGSWALIPCHGNSHDSPVYLLSCTLNLKLLFKYGWTPVTNLGNQPHSGLGWYAGPCFPPSTFFLWQGIESRASHMLDKCFLMKPRNIISPYRFLLRRHIRSNE